MHPTARAPRPFPWLLVGLVAAAVALAVAVSAVIHVAVERRYANDAPVTWPAAVAPVHTGDGPPQPLGQPAGGWRIAFGDEFDGAGLDRSRWEDRSGAEADEGRGNKGNQQLEWNQGGNCAVAGGELVMTAQRETVVSAAGERYDWTSCLISSTPSYTFRYGYIEERAVLPAAGGFWPAFWTWQAPQVGHQVETDVYEQYGAGSRELQMTQHSGQRDGCRWRLPFDPSADWHVYAAAIEPSGTTWYVDGVRVCHTASTADAPTNLVSNLAVYAERPPADGTTRAQKRVDYIRAWQRP